MAIRQDASTGQLVDDGQLSAPKTGTLHVKVHSPFNVYYDGEAQSVSAENGTGPFDILPGHKKFLTLLSPCAITIRNEGREDEVINITQGLMHVKTDGVVVFLDV